MSWPSRFGGEGTGAAKLFRISVEDRRDLPIFGKGEDGREENRVLGIFLAAGDRTPGSIWSPSALRSDGDLLKGLYSFIEDFRRDTKSAT